MHWRTLRTSRSSGHGRRSKSLLSWGFQIPTKVSIRADFPLLDLPTIAMYSPGVTWKLTLFKTEAPLWSS